MTAHASPGRRGLAPRLGERDAPDVRAWARLGVLVLGYVGIYLCRKNFAVANPLIRDAFHLSRGQIGLVASYSTAAYMVGKFVFGPIIDRGSGRLAFLLSLGGVAVFGALGGGASSLFMLTVVYSANRLAGSAGWGGMVKQVPEWFAPRSMSLAMGILSLSFVFGGALATILAGLIASWTGNDWRWVMAGPSVVLLAILAVCSAMLPRESQSTVLDPSSSRQRIDLRAFAALARVRGFWIACALSFVLTLLRETFNTWTVDFFTTTGGAASSSRIAAFLSTPFDAFGAVGIVLLGWGFGRIGRRARQSLLFGMLASLALLIFALPVVGARSVVFATVLVGGIGFFSYGPYSLLAGVFAVEINGKQHVATVAGILDGVGYFAAILSGAAFGRVLDLGGYHLGFNCLAALAGIAAVLCLFLYDRAPQSVQSAEMPKELTLAT